jgi:hypothetical protein
MSKIHHEKKYQLINKTDAEEFVEVNEPQLSVALSGTQNKLFSISLHLEDGLFSRFIFMYSKQMPFG